MPIKRFSRLLALLLAAVVLCLSPAPARAQGASAGELIAVADALRTIHGQAPYQAERGWVSVSQAPHRQWSGQWHAFTLIGFSNGKVGAGIGAGSDGCLYNTLIVNNTGALAGLPGSQVDQTTPGADLTPQGTQQTAEPAATATPQEDGSIVHTVGAGETLWSIAQAYQVSVSDLATLNLLDPENPLIYPGDTIMIRQGFTPTPTGTVTGTPLPPTRTLRPSRTPQPAWPSGTPSLIAQETAVPLVPGDTLINQQNVNRLGMVTLIVATLGVGALIFGRIWTRKGR